MLHVVRVWRERRICCTKGCAEKRFSKALRDDRGCVKIKKLLKGGLWDNDFMHERIATSSAVKIEEEL